MQVFASAISKSQYLHVIPDTDLTAQSAGKHRYVFRLQSGTIRADRGHLQICRADQMALQDRDSCLNAFKNEPQPYSRFKRYWLFVVRSRQGLEFSRQR